MTKQFNLTLIPNATLVEKKSELTLKYKKEQIYNEEEGWNSEKIVVGLPIGKQSEEWTSFVFRPVRIFTNTKPHQGKYPVMLEYEQADKSLSFMTEIEGQTHVMALIGNEILLVASHEEMVPQESVFEIVSDEIIPFSQKDKCLYWTIDNEFKLLDKVNSSDYTQIFTSKFKLGDENGQLKTSEDTSNKEVISTFNPHTLKAPIVAPKPHFPQTYVAPQTTTTTTTAKKYVSKKDENADAEIFMVFLMFVYLVIAAILIIYEPRMAFVAGAFFIIFICLAESTIST